MAELMNENEQKLYEKLKAHNSDYYGYELSKDQTKTILQAFAELKKYRATTESEIRAKAISDFLKALEELTRKNWIDHLEYGITWADLELVAEQLKEK